MSWLLTNICLWLAWGVYWFVCARFVARTKSSETWRARLSHLVPLGIGFFLVFHDRRDTLICGRLYESRAAEIAGDIITAAGLSFAIWARVHLGRYWSAMVTIKQGHELIRSGPYRWVRHPIYTGFLVGLLGSAITVSTGDAFIGLAVVVATCMVKIRREERLLTAEFGDSYRQFQRDVPMLLPFIL